MTEWTEPIKIRPARVDDAKEIARIYNQGVQDRAATFENAYVTPEERYLWLVARPDKYPGRKLCQVTGWKEVGIHEKHGKLGKEWHDLVLVEYLIPENLH